MLSPKVTVFNEEQPEKASLPTPAIVPFIVSAILGMNTDSGIHSLVFLRHFKAEGISRQEEVLFDDGSKQLVALYYRAPELAEMMQAFVGFEEMIHVEVQEDGWLIRVIV